MKNKETWSGTPQVVAVGPTVPTRSKVLMFGSFTLISCDESDTLVMERGENMMVDRSTGGASDKAMRKTEGAPVGAEQGT